MNVAKKIPAWVTPLTETVGPAVNSLLAAHGLAMATLISAYGDTEKAMPKEVASFMWWFCVGFIFSLLSSFAFYAMKMALAGQHLPDAKPVEERGLNIIVGIFLIGSVLSFIILIFEMIDVAGYFWKAAQQ